MLPWVEVRCRQVAAWRSVKTQRRMCKPSGGISGGLSCVHSEPELEESQEEPSSFLQVCVKVASLVRSPAEGDTGVL